MISTAPDGTGAEWIDTMKQAGFDYIELPVVQLHDLTDKAFELIVGKLDVAGLACEVCNNFLPAHHKITGPHIQKDALCRYLDIAVSRIDMLGAKIVVFGSAGARYVPDGFAKEEAMGQIVEFLRELGSLLPSGITVVIEPVCSIETNIIQTISEGLAVMESINLENVQLMADYYHMINSNDSFENLKSASKHLKHLHIAAKSRAMPICMEEGLRDFLEHAEGAEYTGRVSIEALSRSPRHDLALAGTCLRENIKNI